MPLSLPDKLSNDPQRVSRQEIQSIQNRKNEVSWSRRSATLMAVSSLSMSRVLVSGSSGLIGSALIPSLKSVGARVTRLTRPSTAPGTNHEERIPWNPPQPISPAAVSGFDAVIHLAGENIASRW